LRTQKLILKTGEEANQLFIDMAKCYLIHALYKTRKAGEEALMSFTDGDELKVMMMGMKRFTKFNPINIKEIRRNIAEEMISQNKFPYSLYS